MKKEERSWITNTARCQGCHQAKCKIYEEISRYAEGSSILWSTKEDKIKISTDRDKKLRLLFY